MGNGQWQKIDLWNGQLQSNQLKHFGQIAARTKMAVLSSVKLNNFEEFSSSFTEELCSGGNCVEVRFWDSTAEEWGKELKRMASNISWKVTNDQSDWIEIRRN